MITIVLVLVAGASATDARIMGLDAVGMSTYTFSASGLLINAEQWPGLPT